VAAEIILLVDDDDSVRRSLRRLLTLHGYEIYEASDRNTALEAARRYRPHIIILDLHMSSVDGLQIAREIKADTGLSGTGLIAFSASLPEWDEDLQLFHRVVPKPANAEVLLKAIAETAQRAGDSTAHHASASRARS
jgi:DNA-binding response OmpR family regulator